MDMQSNQKNTELFLSLLMRNQRKISSYIRSLVPNFSDSDDIMQETISTMWKKFDQFELGTDFASWGVIIAYYQVMNYRKKKRRDLLYFNEDIFNQICDVAKERYAETDDRIQMLRECIQKLKHEDQYLLKARYELNYTAKYLAVKVNRSIQYIYKHLSRIHCLLNACVKKQIRRERESYG